MDFSRFILRQQSSVAAKRNKRNKRNTFLSKDLSTFLGKDTLQGFRTKYQVCPFQSLTRAKMQRVKFWENAGRFLPKVPKIGTFFKISRFCSSRDESEFV